ncbi:MULTISPECIES: tyrosine--tRNA ligase [unclassified Marinobacterium]|uniref:tyrosine--tRNA ligase n=1 Tax=unclassified Marinobacterium TaxID=2644139 RepID=UPI00156A7174|nr:MULTISPECIES: tyrosine--tRNA ligase [unclassified Marinobacterium]NRP10768.1 Tyrosine--tRNA ligase [Marinobacterium sp. xm-g-48]NRP14666.1 Tyrosine--tRNA ligase [Marinobacterium sp. xm-a-152]NRP27166.1 Tyrosine--tRNA ligase [Marinobacterium sp. xm-d-420]NRP36995.1 Tyrosine--tRNA ligase [Marinobacterium sp. xm-d-579]NRP38414.1 Tyrosine--tRNA ligase [Marinobacterium sp. xm-a-121]
MANINLIAELQSRGLVAQMSSEDELMEHLEKGSVTLYCGFDPTADSLHIGSLVPLLTLRRFQEYGHKPLALVGGATGLIGDPSFKAQERKLNDDSTVAGWVDKLKAQVSQFISFDNGDNSAEVVNNLDWTRGMDVLTFLRDVGKHFSVNSMIAKESVKQRIDREGSGISFTEFTYMILQSFDFQQLNKSHGCTLQIGGSDQWGNITGGIELSRRMNGNQVFGITLPLVTKSDGTKFGKTESGTIWLDATKTSPYAFYQFWMSTADADVYKFLRYFTFLDVERIADIEEEDKAATGRPQAQAILAEEVTRLVHGNDAVEAAKRITESLFSGDISQLSEADFEQLKQDGLPATQVPTDLSDTPLTTLLVDAGMANSGKQIKDALQRDAVIVNDRACGMADNMSGNEIFSSEAGLFGKYFLVKLGKKKHHLFYL